MQIPVQNIYYLLCYAWNKLDEKDLVAVDATASTKLVDLFARVLISGIGHLLKRGFDRVYISVVEESFQLRGRIQFAPTVRRNLLNKGQISCEFDELSYNSIHNQILKTTLTSLIAVEELDEDLRELLVWYRHRLHEVEEINLSKTVFARVVLHRNNYFYDFLLKICELIYYNLLPTQDEGKWRFRDFLRDEDQMAVVFENFIRNFYKLEAKQFRVGREDIQWKLKPVQDGAADLLPKMQTDISLSSANRKIIIECKYKGQLFQEHYGALKFHSTHLFQVHAYLDNLADSPLNNSCQAILLYPTVTEELRKDYTDLKGRLVSIRTIDLNQNWQNIHKDLLAIIGCPAAP